ncbi:MAG: PEP/pyruvate-binding domain-containing protein, partial [Planctomycetota bacterium]
MVDLFEAGPVHAHALGSKALRLAEAQRAGFLVPQGFCLTQAALDAVLGAALPDGTNLRTAIDEALSTFERSSSRLPDRAAQAALAIREHFDRVAMPSELTTALTEAYS